MNEKFTVNFNHLAQTLLPQKSYRLGDVENRIEKVAYDLVRFRDNEDTDQLWKIQDSPDGPVIVALYGEDGGLSVQAKGDWETVPDKKAMHIFYKGEPVTSLSSADLGIPTEEFGVARRWLPRKLAADESLQKELLGKIAEPGRKLLVQRFPELSKVAGLEVSALAKWAAEIGADPEDIGEPEEDFLGEDWEDEGEGPDEYEARLLNRLLKEPTDEDESFPEDDEPSPWSLEEPFLLQKEKMARRIEELELLKLANAK